MRVFDLYSTFTISLKEFMRVKYNYKLDQTAIEEFDL